MHYIRCLRPPNLAIAAKNARVELLFTVTTDLGDSFLSPETPIKLHVTAHRSSDPDDSSWSPVGDGQVLWKAGQRIAKPVIQLPPPVAKALTVGERLQLCISPASNNSARSTDDVLSKSVALLERNGGAGLILPVWVDLEPPVRDDRHTSTRRLQLSASDPPVTIEVAEEIGESIARHIWDAGVVALCAFSNAGLRAASEPNLSSCMQAIREILDTETPLSILELGCGVGILSVGIAAIYSSMHPTLCNQCTILLTDLEEAENQARANITRQTPKPSPSSPVEMLYENLDWEDGRRQQFGPLVDSRRWDLIVLSDCTYNVDMLPALVETLSALHERNARNAIPDAAWRTRVFLATKPRHSSERALFNLMSQHGWVKVQEHIIPLPTLGSEDEQVELYLFEKR